MTFRIRKLSDSQKSLSTQVKCCSLYSYGMYSHGRRTKGQKEQVMLLCAMLLAV